MPLTFLEFELSNREIAFLFWGTIVLLFLIWQDIKAKNNNGGSLLFKTLFSKTFVTIFTLGGIFILGVHFAAWRLGFWSGSDFHDSLVWSVTVAPVLIFKSIKPPEKYFKQLVLDGLKLTILLEFIVNFYSFDLWVELLIIPFVGFFSGLQAFASGSKKESDRKIGQCVETFLQVLFAGLAIYSIVLVFIDLNAVVSEGSARSILVPYILTLMFIPFLYFLSLYAAYELLHIKVKFLAIDHPKSKKIWRTILWTCGLSRKRVKRTHQWLNKDVFYKDMDLKKHFSVIARENKYPSDNF